MPKLNSMFKKNDLYHPVQSAAEHPSGCLGNRKGTGAAKRTRRALEKM